MSSLSSNQLTELLGLVPFSEGLGVKLEGADPSSVAGTLAWSAGRSWPSRTPSAPSVPT
jgi:hypothetical protein